jgi:LysM repeat protein
MKRRTWLALAAGLAIAVFVAPTTAFAQTQHRVVSGDTLWEIGVTNHTTWQALAAYNHIQNPNLIFVNQIVVIPDSGYTAPAAAPVVHYQVKSDYVPQRTYAPKPYSGYQSCVAWRESTNGAGSSNIYGFLQSTWNSMGYSGSPSGASRSTQDAAFQRLYAMDGTSPWSPYDGC